MSLYKQVLNKRTGVFNLVPSASAIAFKDSVADFASLPASGNTINDGRITNDTGHLYIWSGTAWVDQGDFIDFTWDALSGKPTSTPANIDSTVTLGAKQLIASTVYYVNCDTGSNSNPGTDLLPFRTVTHAILQLPKNLGYQSVVIYLQPSLNYAENIALTGFCNINTFQIYGQGVLGSALITSSVPITIRNCFGKISIYRLSLKVNGNFRTCINVAQTHLVELLACNFSSGGYSSTTGVNCDGSIVRLTGTTVNSWDYDADKVAIGVKSINGGIVKFVDTSFPTFGTALYNNSNTGMIILGTGKNIVDANFDLAVDRQHLQGTDQGLDTGGANAVIVSDVKDAVTKKHTQNTDTSIGTPSGLVLDKDYSGTDNAGENYYGGGYDMKIAQPYVPGLSGELQKVTLKLGRTGTPSGDFTVELRNTELDGTPSAGVLATVTKLPTDIPLIEGEVDFTFSVPYSVVSGTRYAIVTYGTGQDVSNYYTCKEEAPGTFDIGYYYDYGSAWVIQNTTLHFKTYVYQAGTTLTPSSTTENFAIAGEMSVKVYSQASEPVLGANNRIAIWIDTDDSNRVYILFKRGTGDQVAVELA